MKIYVPAVRGKNGKTTIVTEKEYERLAAFHKKRRRERRIRRIRAVVTILAAIGSMLLITGAACKLTDPRGAWQVVGLCALAGGLLITAIVAGVTEGEDDDRK